MTGLSIMVGDLTPKRLELLKLAVPNLSRVAWLINPDNPYVAAQHSQMQSAADAVGVTLIVANWNALDDINTVFVKVTRNGAQAIEMSVDPLYNDNVRKISDAAIKYRLAAISPARFYAKAGALLSYGVDYQPQFRQAAAYVVKIFKGAKPADLPIELPSKIEIRKASIEMDQKVQFPYVTGKLTVSYLKPAPIDSAIELRARVVEFGERKALVKCSVTAKGVLCAEAEMIAVRARAAS